MSLLNRINVMDTVFTLQYHTVNQSFCFRIHQNTTGIGRTRGLSHQDNIVGIATEVGYVTTYPSKSGLSIRHTEIAG